MLVVVVLGVLAFFGRRRQNAARAKAAEQRASAVGSGRARAEVVPGTIVSATEVGPASAPAQTPAPTPTQPSATTPTTAPAPAVVPQQTQAPAPQGNAAKPTDVPQAGQVVQQDATAADRARAKARAAARRKAAAAAKAKAAAEKAKQEAQAKADAAGAPTAADPTFSLALPGAGRRSASRTSSSTSSGSRRSCCRSTRPPASSTACAGRSWPAINEIETDYGRNLNVSTAGRRGLDAVPALDVEAVRRRRQRRRPQGPVQPGRRDLRRRALPQGRRAPTRTSASAIFAYNHADWYVDSVLLRARLIGGLPADLVGSLTGLTQGHFPVHAKARYADDLAERDAQRKRRRAAATPRCRSRRTPTAARINIFAKAGAPVDRRPGRPDRQGSARNKRLGRFVQLRDVYGNTYTYAHLGKLARATRCRKAERNGHQGAGRRQASSSCPSRPTPSRPRRQRRPRRSAQAAPQAAATARPRDAAPRHGAGRRAARQGARCSPTRAARRRYKAGGQRAAPRQRGALLAGDTTFKSYFTRGLRPGRRGRRRSSTSRSGRKVIAGTILGPHRQARRTASRRTSSSRSAPPAGRAADRPQADPRRLEAARVDRDLPRRGQEPVLRPRRRRTRRSARSC